MKNKCEKCGHEWIQRTEDKPKQCPKCKRYEWFIAPATTKEDMEATAVDTLGDSFTVSQNRNKSL